jgi:GH3 auxin-responsive promoter
VDLTYFLKVYSKYRYSRISKLDLVSTQEDVLLKLLHTARNTQFGIEHNFSAIKKVQNFQSNVPLRKYEDFWEKYWKNSFPEINNITWPGTIPYFAVSSGTTTGKTKYIPLTNAMIQANARAGLDLLVYHSINNPKSRLFSGKSFVLGGSTNLVEESPGIFSGDLSGVVAKTLPWWAKYFYYPPPQLALLSNWEEKIQRLAEGSLKEKICSISGVPSWMLILFEKLATLTPNSNGQISKIFPDLQMIVHGGVNFAPYYNKFKQILEGSNAELREVYPASEGFFAIADRNYGEGLRLISDNGIFYEFVPLEELSSKNPTRHWIGNIEPNINYALVLTTNAGLWSYIIGDTVRFIETSPPRLLVTGRTSYFISAFGEHLDGSEVEASVMKAAKNANLNITDYSFGALYPQSSSDRGGHLLVVECESGILEDSKLNKFSLDTEHALCEENDDYKAHLADGFGLNHLKVFSVKPGTFAAWMKKRGKLGGQHKVPRIINDQNLFDDLRMFVGEKVS